MKKKMYIAALLTGTCILGGVISVSAKEATGAQAAPGFETSFESMRAGIESTKSYLEMNKENVISTALDTEYCAEGHANCDGNHTEYCAEGHANCDGDHTEYCAEGHANCDGNHTEYCAEGHANCDGNHTEYCAEGHANCDGSHSGNANHHGGNHHRGHHS